MDRPGDQETSAALPETKLPGPTKEITVTDPAESSLNATGALTAQPPGTP